MPALTPRSGNSSGRRAQPNSNSSDSRRHARDDTLASAKVRASRRDDASDKENNGHAARRPRVVSGSKRAAGAMSDLHSDSDAGTDGNGDAGLDGQADSQPAENRAGKRQRLSLPERKSEARREAKSRMTSRSRTVVADEAGVDEEDEENGEEEAEQAEQEEERTDTRRRRKQQVEVENVEDDDDDDDDELEEEDAGPAGVGSASSRRKTRFYDPEQSMMERRAVRKNIRDLAKDLNDSRADYMKPDSDGLARTVQKANENFANIKQTSEATLDSRLLVQAGDLGARRAARSDLGSTAGGINIDEFVSKVIRFMQRGPTAEQAAQTYPEGSSQRDSAGSHHRRTQQTVDDDDGDDDLEGTNEELDWEYLGRVAAYPHMARPGLPTFLLGPLSVQKKARKVTQRTARQRLDPRDAVRPDELELEDIERNENSNLGHMCRSIMALLETALADGAAAVEAEVERAGGLDDAAPELVDAIMDRHNIRDDGGVCLFNFAFDPRDFGQTVENMFYISFLIRDGRAGIGADSRGCPTLHKTNPMGATQPGGGASAGREKNQGVFHLDHKVWRKLCRAYGVTQSIIPHRQSEVAHEAVTGWYG